MLVGAEHVKDGHEQNQTDKTITRKEEESTRTTKRIVSLSPPCFHETQEKREHPSSFSPSSLACSPKKTSKK
jgi:hypothetical protein